MNNFQVGDKVSGVWHEVDKDDDRYYEYYNKYDGVIEKIIISQGKLYYNVFIDDKYHVLIGQSPKDTIEFTCIVNSALYKSLNEIS